MASAFGDRSSQALLSEIQTLKSIINEFADGVAVVDNGGKFLFFNHVAESILGIGAIDGGPGQWTNVYGCFRSDGVTPFPAAELPLARVLAGDGACEAEIFIRNQQRTKGTWILASATPLHGNQGERIGGIVVFRDITKKRSDESRIRTLMNAVEQTADSIIVTDRDGLIQYVNPAFEETTGYKQAEVLGHTPSILKSGLHDAEFYGHLWETIRSGKVFRATISNRKKNGEIYFAEQTITPMRDAAGDITHFVSVVKDVTEQRKLEAQEAAMQLARAVQQKFYREVPPAVDGFEFAGDAFPADATGGDYFDFVPLPKSCVGIAIGDVCGHGIGSALLMAELRAFLRSFSYKSLHVGEILALINQALVSDLEEESYATLIFCRLHPASRTLVYGSAGHVPGYILGADGAVKHVLNSKDIPLGLLVERRFGCSEAIPLEVGDILILLTDGITEAERPDQTQFGAERALDFVRMHRDENATEIIAGLYEEVRAFANGLPQNDDITAVICKCTHRAARPRKRKRSTSP